METPLTEITEKDLLLAGRRNDADAYVRDVLDEGLEPENLPVRYLPAILPWVLTGPSVTDEAGWLVWRGRGYLERIDVWYVSTAGVAWDGEVQISRDGGATFSTVYELAGVSPDGEESNKPKLWLGDGHVLRLRSLVALGVTAVVSVTPQILVPMGGG